jgi:FkbM family methyltransferase
MKPWVILITCLIGVALITLVVLFFTLRPSPYNSAGFTLTTNRIDGSPLVWENSKFVKDNWPDLDFDVDEKKEIFNLAKTLPKNQHIIDVGAHIGDLAIQLAAALRNVDRNDVIVYAVEPSQAKCDFMERVKKQNKLKNLVIIPKGLYSSTTRRQHGQQPDNNTGATRWNKQNLEIDLARASPSTEESGEFVTADSLFQDINIGLYHIDVEGHEFEVLEGSKQLLTRAKPIIIVEHWVKDRGPMHRCTGESDCPSFYSLMTSLDYCFTRFISNGDSLWLHI